MFEVMIVANMILKTLIFDNAKNFMTHGKRNTMLKIILQKQTENIRRIHTKGNKNNNRMERLSSTIRDREIAFRGIKKMDSSLFDKFQTYYNYYKKHNIYMVGTSAQSSMIEV